MSSISGFSIFKSKKSLSREIKRSTSSRIAETKIGRSASSRMAGKSARLYQA
jgi:hypothetical protein